MRCQHCEAECQAKTTRRKFCGDPCRKAFWQAERDHEVIRAVEALERATDRLRRMQRGRRAG